ncbi:hypothetical protein E2C01_019784 [Portunus trituberculatus]|uniref:Uncharacterized protein n=1 Tax=Portunus trituberculatus TaxID=210409 RepID=A0A5B7DYW1_PORTR|nr:hypothetical protein [Portunus trituberculatus]
MSGPSSTTSTTTIPSTLQHHARTSQPLTIYPHHAAHALATHHNAHHRYPSHCIRVSIISYTEFTKHFSITRHLTIHASNPLSHASHAGRRTNIFAQRIVHIRYASLHAPTNHNANTIAASVHRGAIPSPQQEGGHAPLSDSLTEQPHTTATPSGHPP